MYRVILPVLLLGGALGGCRSEYVAERARSSAVHAAAAEAALGAGDFSRASAAAELAAAYDPLNPRYRDLLLRVRLTTLAGAPHLVTVDRPVDLDYQAEAMLAKDPAHVEVYKTARGYLALTRNDLVRGEALFREALAAAAAYAPAQLALGHVLAQSKKPEEAIAAFEQALKLDPKSASGSVSLGKLLLEKGQYDRAVDLLRKAIDLGDSAAARLAMASALVGLQKIPEAGEHLQRAVALEPRNGDAHRQLGDWLFAMNQVPPARQEYSTASQLGAEPLATFGLAMVAQKMEEHSRAAELFDAVARAAPQLSAAFYQAGVAHESAGHGDDAADRYMRYVQLAGQTASERPRVEDAMARLKRLQTTQGRPSPAPAPHGGEKPASGKRAGG